MWFDGIYSTNQAHARTRFKCAPRATQDDAWKKHPFYVPTPRREPRAGLAVLDRTCDECEHVMVRSEGPVTARRFIYSAREAAKVLKSVPYGGTYREISHDVRRHAHRGIEDDHGRLVTSANGSLAADYLDLYADLVYDHFAPTEWPEVVALDALPFRVRAWADGQTVRGGKPKASILGAFGYPEVGKKGRVWHVAVSGGLDQLSWEHFLRSMPTNPTRPPRYVICDDDAALQLAVAAVWPQATIYVSEDAIRRSADKTLGRTKKLGGRRYEVEQAIYRATWSPRHWRELEELARILPPDGQDLRDWIVGKRPLMERQFRVRQRSLPRSAGALEQFFTVLKDVIGIRRYRFRNAFRLERLARMVVLRHTQEADEREFARLIRQHLEANDGRVGVKFRAADRTDTKGEPCSIKRLETEATQRRADGLNVVIPIGATTKQVKRLFKNARFKRNQERRLDAMTPDERAAEEARLRERNRGYVLRSRERQEARKVEAGLPPTKRRGPFKPRSPAMPPPLADSALLPDQESA